MKKQILGIDVGGTKIAAGLVDEQLKVTKLKVLRTSQTGLVKQLVDLITAYGKLDGIGIGVPGFVDDTGFIYQLPNVKAFEAIDLRTILEKKFLVPVSVANDAKSFALAEAVAGAGKNYRTVAGVILGTGIGMGVVMDKQIYQGKNFIAGEIGHLIRPEGKTFEEQVQAAGKFKNAASAKKFIKQLLNFIVWSFEPEIIIVGGGWSTLSGMQKVLVDSLKTVYRLPIKTRVVVSNLKNAGVIGAALPFWKGLKK